VARARGDRRTAHRRHDDGARGKRERAGLPSPRLRLLHVRRRRARGRVVPRNSHWGRLQRARGFRRAVFLPLILLISCASHPEPPPLPPPPPPTPCPNPPA